MHIDTVLLKVASRCNLDCSYCYVYNHADKSFRHRPAFMSRQVFESLVKRIGDYCASRPSHVIDVVFHGGEPMLLNPRELDGWLTTGRCAVKLPPTLGRAPVLVLERRLDVREVVAAMASLA